MKWYKQGVFIFVLVLLALLLAACGPATPAPTPGPSPTPSPPPAPPPASTWVDDQLGVTYDLSWTQAGRCRIVLIIVSYVSPPPNRPASLTAQYNRKLSAPSAVKQNHPRLTKNRRGGV